ncbi:MAG TPA: GNAT family N-acetyltransferase [Candidatus Dormibacteraeota bacterium]|jgi:RimJ/RimL family protein N-acetyltransferase|nr:GNAT family N-acetyltransferase [Candidatus Dormibacteraeota bacterium]
MDTTAAAVPPERLEAGDVVLRRWRMDDAPLLLRAIADNLDHLRPYMPWAGQPPTTESVDAYLRLHARAFEPRREAGYAIVAPGDDSEIRGGCSLHDQQRPGIVSLGYWVHRDHLRRGHATAAARVLTATAFTLPGIQRVEIHCDETNAASAAVPRRLGFRLDGVVFRAALAPAETGRDMVWVMDRPAWAAEPQPSA